MSRDPPCNGVTISLEEKVKAVEMEEFNVSLVVVSSSPVSRLLTVTPSWDGLKVLGGGQLEVKIIMIIIVIVVIIVITIANILCLKVERGEKEEEWLVTMVGQQFYLYNIKVMVVMIMILLMIIIITMI